VWSFDRAFKGHPGAAVEKTLGVKVADETRTVEKVFGDAAKVRQPKPKESRALRILGIKEDPVAGQLEGTLATPSTTPTGGGAAAKEAEETAAKTVTKVEEAGASGLGKAVVKAEEAVAEAAAKPKFYKQLAAKLGKLGVELLESVVPDPLDALELMYDFAGSYKEAWERIKRDNLTSGFAIGLAAYLVVPRWEWAKYFARTTVSRDVATQVVGAVGIAENAFNEGLVRGFLYGELHSKTQADKLRQNAFDTLVKAGHMPGRFEGDDVYTFGRDDVYSFAAALIPTAVAVLKEADRRRAARLESEKLREDMKKWSRRQPGEV